MGYYWVRSTWVRSSSAAQSLDVFGHCDRFDAIWIIGVLGTKSAHLATLAQHSVSAHHHVLLHKDFGAPLLHAGVYLQGLAISGRADESRVDLQQWRTDDAARFGQLTPRRYTTLDKVVQRRCVHPFREVGEEDYACRVTVSKHHLHFVNDGFAHRALSAGSHAQCTIQPDDFAVEVVVTNDVASQLCKLAGLTQPCWKRDTGSE